MSDLPPSMRRRPGPEDVQFVLDKLGPGPEEIRYQKCLALIVAEFKSDPMSVQCFDARIVKKAIELVDAYEKRHARYFKKYGRGEEAGVE